MQQYKSQIPWLQRLTEWLGHLQGNAAVATAQAQVQLAQDPRPTIRAGFDIPVQGISAQTGASRAPHYNGIASGFINQGFKSAQADLRQQGRDLLASQGRYGVPRWPTDANGNPVVDVPVPRWDHIISHRRDPITMNDSSN